MVMTFLIYMNVQGRDPTHQGGKPRYNSQRSLQCSCKECKIQEKLLGFSFLAKLGLQSLVVVAWWGPTLIFEIKFNRWTNVFCFQWAHFPHIHFGLMPDQTMKKTNVRQQVYFHHWHPLYVFLPSPSLMSLFLDIGAGRRGRSDERWFLCFCQCRCFPILEVDLGWFFFLSICY